MWQSLYLYSDSAPDSAPDAAQIAETLRSMLAKEGYEPYDPFAAMLGKSYPLQRRLFIAPAAQGWTRVLGDADESLMPALSTHGLCLRCALEGITAQITAYDAGVPVEAKAALTPHCTEATLTPHLATDCTEATLARILAGELDTVAVGKDRSSDSAVPMDALPDDVRAMAEKLNPKQIDRMFGKWMKRVSKRLGGDEAGARDLLRGDAVDWNSDGGRQIQALMGCLDIPPDSWRYPDFTTVRDAYQLHLRRQRRPDARLLPGDAEAMQAVPDALDYTPVYMGKAG